MEERGSDRQLDRQTNRYMNRRMDGWIGKVVRHLDGSFKKLSLR
jgi:hypothetical protein